MSKGPHKNQARTRGRVDKSAFAGRSGTNAKATENDANNHASPFVSNPVESADSSIPDTRAEQRDIPDPISLGELLKREKEAIQKSREGVYSDKALPPTNLTGLSLSGGGIRSACFNLGLLEGLDRLECDVEIADKLKPTADRGCRPNHLELFDYVSSVSGGSYAAGHLATAMLSPNGGVRTDSGAKFDPPEWLGKVPLTSKTVPGWLWGVGVWFLGVAFQLLKTGSFLLCVLAAIAYMLRTLDSRDAIRLCESYGLDTDVERGFIPFWFALGIFLVGYWINASKQRKRLTKLWFGSAAMVIFAYVGIITFSLWSPDHNWPWLFYWPPEGHADDLSPLRFGVQYFFLLVFPATTAAVCLVLVAGRGARWLWHLVCRTLRLDGLFERLMGNAGGQAEHEHADSWVTTDPVRLRRFLLVPVLVALFCLAGLVTTGDVNLISAEDGAAKVQRSQERSRELAEKTNFIYRTAISLLGLSSLVFLFPRNLFKSARKVEDRASGRAEAPSAALKRWGLEPVFRVVVFLCSYGFVLLVIFVLYSTVAGENVSGYYEWREDLPYASFHQDDFKNRSQAWELIALDAAGALDSGRASFIGPPDLSASWGPLATRLMAVRNAHFQYEKDRVCGDEVRGWEIGTEFSLEQDRAVDGEIRALGSLPWIVRLFPSLMWLGPKQPWDKAGFDLKTDIWRLYALNARQFRSEVRLASRIAGAVLSDPELYLVVPNAPPEALPSEQESERNPGLKEKYLARVKSFATFQARAKSLATLDSTKPEFQDAKLKPAIQAAIRNNNRMALQLYLPDHIRDRKEKVVFASIVWAEDQWTRFRIVLIAGVIWVLCCAVDVNSFSLQKFYRGHVIDSWVKLPPGKNTKRWLHQTMNTYRGHEFGKRPHEAVERRAPLLLINTTLEGNRSLGDEPGLSENIFTFSRLASGSGQKHWLNGVDGRRSLARRSDLDIGNIVATSGAFLSPGTIANPALSAILHLLNVQTGYWARDPRSFEARNPMESLLFHVAQSLGVDRNGDSRFMLTDGAHVENLGVYVLLQRGCSLIVTSDCSQEDHSEKPQRRFDTLMQVLQQAQVDGIEVSPFLNSRAYRHWLKTGNLPRDGGDFDDCRHKKSAGLDLLLPPDPIPSEPSSPWNTIASAIASAWPSDRNAGESTSTSPAASSSTHKNGKAQSPAGSDSAAAFAQEHYLFAQIVYPDKSLGLLVYLRPTLTGDEGDSLLHGASGSRFPDDDPMDQFYTPAKMNTYRLLGRHIATELMYDPVMIDAFKRIAQGEPAGKSPERNAEDGTKEFCATHCREIGSSCSGQRQRTFRPPVRPVQAMSTKDCETLKGLMSK